MKLVYFGLPLGALCLLQSGRPPALAVLSPVRAPGRRRLGRRVAPGTLRDARRLGQRLDAQVSQDLARLRPDLIVCWYWSRRLSPAWLSAARLGAIGAHPSLLPRHRGADPFFWAIDSGDRRTGVSIHRLVHDYDAGEVLAQTAIPIGERNAWQLARALDRPGLQLLTEVVRTLDESHAPVGLAQDPALATQAKPPSGAELKLPFGESTERVLRRLRALSPVPGAALELCGVRFFVTRARAHDTYPEALAPGEASIRPPPSAELLIRTGTGAIVVERAVLGAASRRHAKVNQLDPGDGPAGAPVPGRVLTGWQLAELLTRRHPSAG